MIRRKMSRNYWTLPPSLLIIVYDFRMIVRTRPGREGESLGSTRQHSFHSLFHPPPVRASSITVNSSIYAKVKKARLVGAKI